MGVNSVVVIGGSAGGYQAVADLMAHVPPDLDTAFFVVVHVSRKSVGAILVKHIQNHTSYICRLADDNEPIQKGHLYVAPPDFHLLVKNGHMRVIRGPHENRWRPSIDVLFRSAAAAYDSHTIGIILSGLLDDGTSGMSAIKRSGGICIVQEPHDAEFDDMPHNVLNNVAVDHSVPVAEMGYVLDDIFSKPFLNGKLQKIPDDVKIESEITERRITDMNELEKIGTRSNYSCPDCGGALWEIKDDVIPRYRCYTGHVFTANVLLEKQAEELEDSLWVSIRMLEERRNLLQRMIKRQATIEDEEGDMNEKIGELDKHIERLKALLITIGKSSPKTAGYE
ncbi:MAG: chemotaxis protein CheB [Mucilaginibacter sp.]|jgi:two-component system chemotaxis response regulator CheB